MVQDIGYIPVKIKTIREKRRYTDWPDPMNGHSKQSQKMFPCGFRRLYWPVQPAHRLSGTQVHYQELLPDIRLQDLIYCYWRLKTEQTLDQSFTYRVVADGCIDLFFELPNPQNSFVMGFCKNYTEFPLGQCFDYAGIRFLPGMFPLFLKVQASDLNGHFASLQDLFPDVAAFIGARFSPWSSFQEIKAELDTYFLQQLSKISFQPDQRFYEALFLILKNRGAVQVEKELQTGLSPRQLRRLFEAYIGDTPKVFGKVVRFQNILSAKPSAQSLRQDKFFFDLGYYDQAHFIKDFKQFYGVTPSQAFR